VVAAAIAAAIEEAGGPLLQDARLFDVYRGGPLGAGERSLAYRLHFGAADRTLTEEEVDAAVAAIVGILAARIGARLRA
jgi:phenylalanyl-tRNA synthetase beta chain